MTCHKLCAFQSDLHWKGHFFSLEPQTPLEEGSVLWVTKWQWASVFAGGRHSKRPDPALDLTKNCARTAGTFTWGLVDAVGAALRKAHGGLRQEPSRPGGGHGVGANAVPQLPPGRPALNDRDIGGVRSLWPPSRTSSAPLRRQTTRESITGDLLGHGGADGKEVAGGNHTGMGPPGRRPQRRKGNLY